MIWDNKSMHLNFCPRCLLGCFLREAFFTFSQALLGLGLSVSCHPDCHAGPGQVRQFLLLHSAFHLGRNRAEPIRHFIAGRFDGADGSAVAAASQMGTVQRMCVDGRLRYLVLGSALCGSGPDEGAAGKSQNPIRFHRRQAHSVPPIRENLALLRHHPRTRPDTEHVTLQESAAGPRRSFRSRAQPPEFASRTSSARVGVVSSGLVTDRLFFE